MSLVLNLRKLRRLEFLEICLWIISTLRYWHFWVPGC